MLLTIRRAFDLFEARERWTLLALSGLVLVMALLQTVSVASILPFMSLVGDPDIISENAVLAWLYTELGFGDTRPFLVFAGLMVLALMAFSNGVSALTQWFMVRFVWHQQHQLSIRLLSRYLSEPYTFFLTRNTSQLTKNMFIEVREALNGVIMQGMKVFAQAVVVLCIFALLMFVDPVLALVSTVVLGGAYGILYTVVRRKQGQLGRIRIRVNGLRFRTANEALGGIKESRVLGRESGFLERFAEPTKEYSRVSARNQVITDLPRYVLETIAFGGILVIMLYILSTREDFGQAVAVMSLYALAGYRLMPALQQVFSGLAKARFFSSALENLHEDLLHAAATPGAAVQVLEHDTDQRLPFERDLGLDHVGFRYPDSDLDVLRHVDLTIPKDSTVGLVGSTGSGKTTIVDLLLGLLEPTEGNVRIDGTPLRPDLYPAWRRNIGYVPQDIFLCDDTVRRNIAFGLPDHRIDAEAVEKAARIAQIHEFITALPAGYETVVGERGVRLSGGQRQRIGIARALYHDPDVLILDEATSALDGITEDGVMEAIRALAGRKTIVLIAHRVSTLRDCDRICLLKNGEVADFGSFERLLERNAEFRAMAKDPAPKAVGV